MATFGVAMPFFDHQLAYDAIAGFAISAQRAGFDGLWLSDHLVVGPPPQLSRTWYDAPTLLAGLAGVVPGMALGTDVLIAAYRHPVAAAKALATVDIVSGGRLTVGVGTGHSEHEYVTVGADFRNRGAVTDEYIQAWKQIWTPGPAVFRGEYIVLDEPELGPLPVRQPHPPIWVGGDSPAAIRRTVRLGDGWHPLSLTPQRYADGVAQLRRECDRLGKSLPTLSYSGFFGDIVTRAVEETTRVPLTGGVEQVIDDVGRLSEIGVRNFVFRLGAAEHNNAQNLEQLALVAEMVLPAVRE
ncbi:TIGR03619 family F420-dependent LLM class oxidoreductase [Mycolicibacterium chitae]|uniref:TIGR03619 family F420-dependent LLM class oxidoreductase n=1 Tax=Mycolicibacterium chitae TaxID=1792 RepID=UPI0013CF83F1|nr:TIGR03619 family F420-dependent LLM class oxidoreductase [Mycolicibacterium chitae]MCV7105092.1 TIGR03619 family F420-dependent LLM class oxidoreductase [Mycolicibacterium chitae]